MAIEQRKSSSIYLTYKVLQLIDVLRRRLKPRLRPDGSKRGLLGSDCLPSLKAISVGSVERDVSRWNGHRRKNQNQLHHFSNRVCKHRKLGRAVLKLQTHGKCDSDGSNTAGKEVEQMLNSVDGSLSPPDNAWSAIAGDEKLFLQHKTDQNFDAWSLNKLIAALVVVFDGLDVFDRARSQYDDEWLISQAREIGLIIDEAFVANYEHILLRLQNQLFDALTRKVIEALLEGGQDKKQRRLLHWFAEFPNNRHPLSTTWPWSIKPSLAVLWGVCWMFYNNQARKNQQPTGIDNAGDESIRVSGDRLLQVLDFSPWDPPQPTDYYNFGQELLNNAVPQVPQHQVHQTGGRGVPSGPEGIADASTASHFGGWPASGSDRLGSGHVPVVAVPPHGQGSAAAAQQGPAAPGAQPHYLAHHLHSRTSGRPLLRQPQPQAQSLLAQQQQQQHRAFQQAAAAAPQQATTARPPDHLHQATAAAFANAAPDYHGGTGNRFPPGFTNRLDLGAPRQQRAEGAYNHYASTSHALGVGPSLQFPFGPDYSGIATTQVLTVSPVSQAQPQSDVDWLTYQYRYLQQQASAASSGLPQSELQHQRPSHSGHLIPSITVTTGNEQSSETDVSSAPPHSGIYSPYISAAPFPPPQASQFYPHNINTSNPFNYSPVMGNRQTDNTHTSPVSPTGRGQSPFNHSSVPPTPASMSEARSPTKAKSPIASPRGPPSIASALSRKRESTEESSQDGDGRGFSPRRNHAYKRSEEPPRNDDNKMVCKYSECANLTFDRKCEWSKHMDKHDRPYKCHVKGCEKLQGFTYSGGLLRHEREVHKMHGGTSKSLYCPHFECKRSSGSGFTRKENLAEHLRRVHRRTSTSSDFGSQVIARAQDTQEEQSSTQAPPVEFRRVTSPDEDMNLMGPKRSRTEAFVDEEETDLRVVVKRLKQENEEKDARLEQQDTAIKQLQAAVEKLQQLGKQ